MDTREIHAWISGIDRYRLQYISQRNVSSLKFLLALQKNLKEGENGLDQDSLGSIAAQVAEVSPSRRLRQ